MILLDTCALLWLAMDQAGLSGKAKLQIKNHAGRLHVSAITAFEIAQKHRHGKLELPLPPGDWFPKALALHGLLEMPLTSVHGTRAAALPNHHHDPFDRLLIGCALVEGLVLLIPDSKIRQYTEVKTAW